MLESSYIGEFVFGSLVVFVFVFLNGFFVAAEFALVKVRDTQLDGLIRQGNRRAIVARKLLSNLDAALSAAQLGITLASLGLGWVAEPIFAHLLQPVLDVSGIESESVKHAISFGFGFSAITFLHIVAGEQTPKLLAIQKPVPATLWIASPLRMFFRVSYPFIWLLNGASSQLLRWVGVEPVSESEMVHSEEELKLLLSAPHGNHSSRFSRNIVLNAFDLSDRIAREVMRPRHEIVFLDTQATIDSCIEVAQESRFSRYPLCESGDLDKTLGVVHIKELYAARATARQGEELARVAHKIIYVPETARLEKLLQFFLERKLHLAIVVDEYGGTVGMVTLENILEELVGQIQDEFDQEVPLAIDKGNGVWEIDGALPLHELAEITGEEIFSEGISTTSGWMTEKLGGLAKVGDVVLLGSHELRVQEIDRLRVDRLKLTRLA